jgi:hypothetical protein
VAAVHPILVDKPTRGFDEPAGPEAAAYEQMLKHLLGVPAGMVVAFTEQAHAIRDRALDELYELEQAEALGPKFTSSVGKLPGLFGRLCLVLSYINPNPLAACWRARWARRHTYRCSRACARWIGAASISARRS